MLPVAGRMRGVEALDAVPTGVEDFYSVLLGQNPPEAPGGDAKPWQPRPLPW